MPACMIVSQNKTLPELICKKALVSINNANILNVNIKQNENLISAVSHVSSCVFKNTRLFDDGTICGWLAGVLPDVTSVPWKEIIYALRNEEYKIFESFSGPFSLAMHDSESGKSYLVSDRCSQYPVFYSQLDNMLIFSTAFKTFFSCLDTKKFDEKWLTDFLIFNFPLNQTTPIENVYRMPAASVLTVLKDGQKELQEYAPIYKANIPSCSEKEMQEKTHSIFSERIPLYFKTVDEKKYAAGITGGFDARTSIAYAPNHVQPQLYTYGIKETDDIEQGRIIANSLGLKHHYLSIGEELLEKLPHLIAQNHDFSGGSNPAMRSVLAFVYNHLAQNDVEGIVTGISADHFFRSSAVTPNTLSEVIVSLVQNPKYNGKQHPYFSILKNSDKATEHYQQSCIFLEKRYDWARLPISERLLTFNHYELAAKHFGGEISLAENFVSLVSPFWDSKIRELTYNTNLSTLTITPLIYEKYPYWKQHQLFSSLLVRHPKLKNIPINHIPPAWYATGNKFCFDLAKIMYRAPKKIYRMIKGENEIPLEAWNDWLGRYVLSNVISEPKKMLLAEYIDSSVLEQVIASELNPQTRGLKTHLGGKIVTAELILREFS